MQRPTAKVTLVIPAQAGIQFPQSWHEYFPYSASTYMRQKRGYVYILASRRNGTLYVGVTSDPVKRIWQHRKGLVEGFTKRYDIKMLVYLEVHETVVSAIQREKAVKKWRRSWKLRLIERDNPAWEDLYESLVASMADGP